MTDRQPHVPDQILERFMIRQQSEASQLAAASDILEIEALDLSHYVATFHCRGLRQSNGAIVETDRFVVGYQFDRNYLRLTGRTLPVLLFEPREAFHPNLLFPAVCIGPVKPSTPLVELIYRTYELLTFQRCTMREDDALNHEACRWARANQERFPLDRRPLKRPQPASTGNTRRPE